MAAHTLLLPIFLALLSLTFPGWSTGQVTENLTKPNFTAIYIFGDSLLDTGTNNYIVTSLTANHPPYGISFPGGIATGRFSDGKLMSDLMAAALGIKDTVPPFLDPNLSTDDIRTGVCFASAGSGLDDITTAASGAIPVLAQPEYMKRYIEKLKGVVGEKEGDRILSGGLVLLTAGSNDMAINYYNSPTRRVFTLEDYHDYLQQRIYKFIQTLHSLGLRNFIIAGLPPLGCSPSQLSASGQILVRECLEEMDSESQTYNKKLITLLPQIESSLSGSRIAYADLYSSFLDMATNPNKYGFTVTDRGCCGTGYTEAGYFCNELVPLCLDRSEYMFFDAIHPSEATYRVITQHWLDTTLSHFF